ncbi:ABC transporter G family member 2 [Linum perenne]
MSLRGDTATALIGDGIPIIINSPNTPKTELHSYLQPDTKPSLSPLKHYSSSEHDLDLEIGSISVPNSFPPSVLSFQNLTYSVKNSTGAGRFQFPFFGSRSTRKETVILNDVSGEAREGEMMAVLGASGAGKSTLIDALADRISRDSLKGSVTLNGEVMESRMLKTISAYVMQDDLLFPMLTVEETLMFAAEFRLPRSFSKLKKKARVEALIDQLGLRSAAKTVIGDEGRRGVSGGERRRVSIGIDIVHDPILLFLDEPTSGLDSTSAFKVVKVLQRIAQSGSIVMMAIHQPSYRILGLLDRLIFLSHGQIVYSGSPTSLPEFFSEFGHPIPENENTAEFALDLIRELEGVPEGTKSLVEFNKSWQQPKKVKVHAAITKLPLKVNAPISFVSSTAITKLPLKDVVRSAISRGKLVSVPTFANPIWIEMAVIGKRSMTNSRRTPELFGIRFVAVLVTGSILATVFWNLDNSPRGAQERIGFFAFAMATTYYTCAESIPAFLQERYIFMRETAHNTYRRSSYVLAHSLIAIPSLIVLSAAFSAVTFWSVGLSGGLKSFLFFFLAVLSGFWAGSSFVSFLAGVISHVMLGFTIAVAILAYFLLFSGFFVSRDRIPSYWIWFHYISLVKYPYEAALLNEFADPTKCFVRGVQMFDNTPVGEVPVALKLKLLESLGSALGVDLTAETCVMTAADVLKRQGIADLSKWGCLWVTVAWGVFFRFLFYVALLLGSKNKRR